MNRDITPISPPITHPAGATPHHGVRRATSADAAALSRALAEAFRNDPGPAR